MDALDHAGSARYALYFTPPVQSLWWHKGCQWLGRDAGISADSQISAGFKTSAIDQSQLHTLTTKPRRYGFHATLKAPFRLAHGCTQDQLLAMVAAFVRLEQPVALPSLEVCLMDDYLALSQIIPTPEVNALAMRCVTYFDALRAPSNAVELARRRERGLSARQEQLLTQWGYPFTEELFRFHMTLTGNLREVDPVIRRKFFIAAKSHFQQSFTYDGLRVDALTVCIEAIPGAPFSVLQRFPFTCHPTTHVQVEIPAL